MVSAQILAAISVEQHVLKVCAVQNLGQPYKYHNACSFPALRRYMAAAASSRKTSAASARKRQATDVSELLQGQVQVSIIGIKVCALVVFWQHKQKVLQLGVKL